MIGPMPILFPTRSQNRIQHLALDRDKTSLFINPVLSQRPIAPPLVLLFMNRVVVVILIAKDLKHPNNPRVEFVWPKHG